MKRQPGFHSLCLQDWLPWGRPLKVLLNSYATSKRRSTQIDSRNLWR